MANGTDTTIVTADKTPDSNIFGISIRAWITLILVCVVCADEILDAIRCYTTNTAITVGEPTYSLALVAVGYYFGQKLTKPTA